MKPGRSYPRVTSGKQSSPRRHNSLSPTAGDPRHHEDTHPPTLPTSCLDEQLTAGAERAHPAALVVLVRSQQPPWDTGPCHCSSGTAPGHPSVMQTRACLQLCALIQGQGLFALLLAAVGSPSGRAWKRWICTRMNPGLQPAATSVCPHQPSSLLPSPSPKKWAPHPKNMVWKGAVQLAPLSSSHCLKFQAGFIPSEGLQAPVGHPAIHIPPCFSHSIPRGARDYWRKVFPPSPGSPVGSHSQLKLSAHSDPMGKTDAAADAKVIGSFGAGERRAKKSRAGWAKGKQIFFLALG